MTKNRAYHVLAVSLYEFTQAEAQAASARKAAAAREEKATRDVAELKQALRDLGHDPAEALAYGEAEAL